MKKPALHLTTALFASLLAASAVTSVVSLIELRRSRELLLTLRREQAVLRERLEQRAAAQPADPAQARPTLSGSPPQRTAERLAAAPENVPLPELEAAAAPPATVRDVTLPILAVHLPATPDFGYPAPDCPVPVSPVPAAEDLRAHHHYAASLYRANPGSSENYPVIELHLLRVLSGDPENARALELLGRVNAERGRWAEALGCFQRALELQPDTPECLRLAGLCALYGGEPGAAEGYFLRACAVNGGVAELWHFLGLARARAGRLEEATAGFLRCLELDRGYQEARLQAGLALVELGRPREARELLREYVKARPGAEGLTALGDCAFALGEVGEAEGLWRRALARIDPETPQERETAAGLYLRLSRAAWQRRDGSQCLVLAQMGLRCEPLPLLRAFQGLGCLAAGQSQPGRAVLQALLEEYPGSEAAALAAEALRAEAP